VNITLLHKGYISHHVITRMRNDDSALCLWPHDFWGRISQKPLEIDLVPKDHQ